VPGPACSAPILSPALYGWDLDQLRYSLSNAQLGTPSAPNTPTMPFPPLDRARRFGSEAGLTGSEAGGAGSEAGLAGSEAGLAGSDGGLAGSACARRLPIFSNLAIGE
jgi:hypothetical protein